jgi:hypothetical protein
MEYITNTIENLLPKVLNMSVCFLFNHIKNILEKKEFRHEYAF